MQRLLKRDKKSVVAAEFGAVCRLHIGGMKLLPRHCQMIPSCIPPLHKMNIVIHNFVVATTIVV